MQAKHPGRALEKAVKGMLPKGPLGYAMIKKLKVYAGGSHPHTAQQPKALGNLRSGDDRQLELRHRPPQVFGGARVHQEGRPARSSSTASPSSEYFGRQTSIMIVKQPLLLTNNERRSTSRSTCTAVANPARPARCATASPAP
jgi:hypothetical protein